MGIVALIIQFIYTLFFYSRIRRYVQRYGQKLSAIGKYKRNCKTLKTTVCCAILGCCFPNFKYFFFRDVITRSDTFAQFVAHFLFVDICIDLFYTGLFLFTAVDDIPSMEETPRRTVFYVSKPKNLEPRRPESVFPILTCSDGMNSTESRTCKCKVTPSDIQIPLVRLTRNAHTVTLYHATFKKKGWKENYPTTEVPKLSQVSCWSVDNQVEKKKTKLEKEKPSTGEKVLQQLDTESLIVDSKSYTDSLDDIHDFGGCLSSEAFTIGDVDDTQLSEIKGIERFEENKSSSLDYDAIEILGSGIKNDPPVDVAQDEKKIRKGAGRFNYLKKYFEIPPIYI